MALLDRSHRCQLKESAEADISEKWWKVCKTAEIYARICLPLTIYTKRNLKSLIDLNVKTKIVKFVSKLEKISVTFQRFAE